jgi:hypothetical protein
MMAKRLQRIWRSQCTVARHVRATHGIGLALDYLLGEKLMRYAETAEARPEFARELPMFVAEVRAIFSRDDIQAYLSVLERVERESKMMVKGRALDPFAVPSMKLQRFSHIKELLLAERLGTS